MLNEKMNDQTKVNLTTSLYREPVSEECKRCLKYIYPLEMIGPVMGNRYHKQCFRCVVCDSQLDFKNFRTNMIDINDKSIFCSSHYPRNGKYLDGLTGTGSISRSSELLNQANYTNTTLNKSFNKSNDSLNDRSSPSSSSLIEKMMNIRDYSSHSMQESRTEKHEEFTSEKKRLFTKSNTEEIISNQRNVKIEESSHSSSIENHKILISSHTEDLSSVKKNESFSNLELNNNNKIKSDITIRPITEAFEPNIHDSFKERDDLYKPNSLIDKAISIDSNRSNHSHLYDIMREIISKETIHNQKSFAKENEYQHLAQYTGANSNLKNIMAEILDNNIRKSSSINSNSKTASTSSFTSDRVFDEHIKDKHLNEVITELMTTDINKTDQSPYLNGILSEALSQSKMNSSLDAYSQYLSKTGYNSKKLSNNSDSYYVNDRDSPVAVDVILKNENFNATKEQSYTSQETLEQKKRIVNGVAVLPLNDSGKKMSIKETDLNLDNQNEDHPYLNNIMKEIIISNNNAASSNYDSHREKLSNNQLSEYSQLKNTSTINKKTSELIPIVVENSSTSSSNKIIRQAAFEEVTSSSSKTTQNAASYHFQSESNSTTSGSKILENDNLPIPKERIIVKPIDSNNPVPIGADKGFGLVRLTIHYDELRSRFSITIHEARHLKNLDKKNLSDPYARIYLTPDDKPSLKRKTKIVKNNLNPIWQETFDYPITFEEAIKKELTVNLKDERGIFEKQESKFLGEVQINLKSIDIKNPYTKWFYLQPLNSVTKLLNNSGL